MPWTLTTFLAKRKAPLCGTLPARAPWPPEETERLASGTERAQLLERRQGGRDGLA
ncbi:conserved hypothetical protein [Segniliparus rotundus DSM 44985]|uniref:Uncharacterized protein n=1 Tax=Segniliparus rotundus (strain ATCC BAA-972 / CDC 1076 / CIP 108378 / DSM 44985 / JCM 13578) TaxID=640132 RepID=D6ZB62_SEGRD|nr:conserved hypothetical protein [Segniliparus rotundus DSM 44985]